MLTIKNLCITAGDKTILRGINLEIKSGEIHVIMGPNGSGKSTFANVLAGKTGFSKISGTIKYFGQDLLNFSPEERANQGLFLAFQNPTEIAGINNMFFLKTAFNAMRRYNNQPELDAFDFMNLVKVKNKLIELDDSLLKRSLNVGFSGGEKKRNEVLQMLVLEPKLAILDEPDSGLDIDALKIVAKGINALRDSKRSIIIITHYQRLLNYVIPDYIHILLNGQITKSGTKELAHELEQKGYGWLGNEIA